MLTKKAEYEALSAKCLARTATTTEMRRALSLGAQLRAPVPAQIFSAPPAQPTKLAAIRFHLAAGRIRSAIAIAAKFPDLGAQREAILDAHGAFVSESFTRQMGKDPAALIAAGEAALRARWPERAAA